MEVIGNRPRLTLFVLVTSVAVLNALALWGDRAAALGEALLQLCTGLAAVICGVVVARRVSGAARWWRLLYVAAVTCWLCGQILWWTGSTGADGGVASAAGVAVYLLLPVLALPAVILLVYSGGGITGREVGTLRHPLVTNVLDGIVAGLSFMILAAMGGFGTRSSAALPRSGNPDVEMAFALAELLIVAAAVVIAMLYDPRSPHRVNYFLLAGGLVTMAASDRLIAYFASVGVDGERWGGIGLVVGPLMIAYAMLESVPRAADDGRKSSIDWAQLILPYIGFLGTAVLFAFHVLIGQELNAFVVGATVLMVSAVTVRQVVAMRAQHLLTERLYRAQRRLGHQVHRDALTGLPNRLLFAQRLDQAMRRGRFVLIFVDLDDFKEVNDRFGHAAGDELLCAVGERLKGCVAETDTLARIGGDEFAILINGEVDQLDVVADRLRVALRDPFPVHGSSVRVRASMGLVTPESDSSQTSDDLLRQADISMYAGKRLGKDTAVVYQPASGVQIDFPTALRLADGGVPAGFRLVYQVVVQLPQGTPVAVEALARWTAPNGIDISPETFVAVAEAAGLGADLDALVLDLACREVQALGLDVDIHVNVGAARLGNPGFEDDVREALSRHRIPPGRLVMEITETVPIVDLADAAAQIERLNTLGVKVALDDFGAGYNSLTYLHFLPVQIVKMDRSLVVGANSHRDLALYRSVVGLCDALGLVAIAEGIESVEQAETVYGAGCRLAQGHLFGSPVPITQLGAGVAVRGG